MLNMDMTQAIAIDTNKLEWQASPAKGVWRKKLAREEAERGHATSIVRYDPGASFSAHNHPLGEEILVLDGTFSDHTGDYSKGSYFRNTPGFIHAPFSKTGCTILVKLHQIQPMDTKCIRINFCNSEATEYQSNWEQIEGAEVLLLHQFAKEKVCIIKTGTSLYKLPVEPKGVEIYIMDGGLSDGLTQYPKGTWLRRPNSTKTSITAFANTLLWVKTGHIIVSQE